jgi:UDP-N-acetylglucosamine diphosphorylase / glucose-1-phosphate thymidylyltransferase / UDP-N-acetylgalactosamine diphosphorylase / glucosamine-1-phosphate N-acetyltransferase / galactosamine-1-phosphate N-acetyltransferase
VTIRNGYLEKALLEERSRPSNFKEIGTFTVDTRVYSLKKNIFDFLKDTPSINAALNNMVYGGLQVAAVDTEGEWSDMIYPWDILRANGVALGHVHEDIAGKIASNVTLKGKVDVATGSVIHQNSWISGPVVISQGCRIGPYVSINGPVSIGANTIIESFAHISNCILGSGVRIEPGAIIQDSIIDDGTLIGPRYTAVSGETDIIIHDEFHHQKMGAMIGEGCHLGAGIITQPGAIIGNHCIVGDLKIISREIPDKSMVV